jgi:tetratricopeptide (TPR) repeat protein
VPQLGGDFERLALSRDGQTLALVRTGREVVVLRAGQPDPFVLAHPEGAFAAVSPDGRWLATGPWNARNIRIWDLHNRGVWVKELPSSHATLTFSPDGRWPVVANTSTFGFWEVGSWELAGEIQRETHGAPEIVAFSADGGLMALTLESRSAVKLFDTASWEHLATLASSHPRSIVALCFSPDGSQLAAASGGDAVQLWDLGLLRQELGRLGLDWPRPPVRIRDAGPAVARLRLRLPADLDLQLALDRRNHEVTAHPRQPQPYLERAQTYEAFRKYDLALGDYRHALSLAPNDAAACNALAWFAAAGPEPYRDLRTAETLARKAVQLGPESWQNRATLGVVYYRLGKWPEAIESLEQAARANAESQGTGTAFEDYVLAMSHHRLGQVVQAYACYERAVRWQQAQPSWLRPHEALRLEALRAEADALLTKPAAP